MIKLRKNKNTSFSSEAHSLIQNIFKIILKKVDNNTPLKWTEKRLCEKG